MKSKNIFFNFLIGLLISTSITFAQWIQTNGPYGGSITSLAISGANLFAGTASGGVFLSTNNGTSWTAVNNGLTTTSVSSLAVSGTNLFAGTSDGYWDDFSLSTVLPKQSVENQIPISYSLQNYPNPFNPTTKISFSLPSSGFVTLKVYDVLGREVALLANRVFTTGKYEVDFNASNLPSGTYICSLRTENKTLVKKLLLIK